MRTRNGVVLKPLTAEQYVQAKGTVPEVEISNRQFNAASGVRITAEGKIIATEEWRLAKNLDSAQGVNLREPRLVTPTNAELIHKIETAKGLEKVSAARKEFGIGGRRNIGIAEFEIEGQKWTRVGHSGEISQKGTAPLSTQSYFKTKIDGHDRADDSEVKLLEEFAVKYADRAKDVKGTIYLFSERPPCGSCTDVFPQFREMFPNVKLEVASGPYLEKQGGGK